MLLTALALGVLAVDQATKVWALGALQEGVRRPLVGDLLGLQLVYNPGAALSIATGMTWLLTLVAVVVVLVVVRAVRRIGSTGWAVALGLLLGGAVAGPGLYLLLEQPSDGNQYFTRSGFAFGVLLSGWGYVLLFERAGLSKRWRAGLALGAAAFAVAGSRPTEA